VKAGAPIPAELATKLTEAASAALSADIAPDRWAAVVDALAYSPVRGGVTPAGYPAEPTPELLEAVKRIADRVPDIATHFGIDPAEAASKKRRRPKRDNAKKKSAPAPAPASEAAPSKAAPSEAAASEAPAGDAPATESAAAASEAPSAPDALPAGAPAPDALPAGAPAPDALGTGDPAPDALPAGEPAADAEAAAPADTTPAEEEVSEG
ncbi:MAG: hypothetical protein R2710_17565, partial [Acidimicrobiales bacterium]